MEAQQKQNRNNSDHSVRGWTEAERIYETILALLQKVTKGATETKPHVIVKSSRVNFMIIYIHFMRLLVLCLVHKQVKRKVEKIGGW